MTLAWLDKGEIAPGEPALEICDGVGCGGYGHRMERHPRTDDGLVPWCYRHEGWWEHADEHVCPGPPLGLDCYDHARDAARYALGFGPVIGHGTGEPRGLGPMAASVYGGLNAFWTSEDTEDRRDHLGEPPELRDRRAQLAPLPSAPLAERFDAYLSDRDALRRELTERALATICGSALHTPCERCRGDGGLSPFVMLSPRC